MSGDCAAISRLADQLESTLRELASAPSSPPSALLQLLLEEESVDPRALAPAALASLVADALDWCGNVSALRPPPLSLGPVADAGLNPAFALGYLQRPYCKAWCRALALWHLHATFPYPQLEVQQLALLQECSTYHGCKSALDSVLKGLVKTSLSPAPPPAATRRLVDSAGSGAGAKAGGHADARASPAATASSSAAAASTTLVSTATSPSVRQQHPHVQHERHDLSSHNARGPLSARRHAPGSSRFTNAIVPPAAVPPSVSGQASTTAASQQPDASDADSPMADKGRSPGNVSQSSCTAATSSVSHAHSGAASQSRQLSSGIRSVAGGDTHSGMVNGGTELDEVQRGGSFGVPQGVPCGNVANSPFHRSASLPFDYDDVDQDWSGLDPRRLVPALGPHLDPRSSTPAHATALGGAGDASILESPSPSSPSSSLTASRRADGVVDASAAPAAAAAAAAPLRGDSRQPSGTMCAARAASAASHPMSHLVADVFSAAASRAASAALDDDDGVTAGAALTALASFDDSACANALQQQMACCGGGLAVTEEADAVEDEHCSVLPGGCTGGKGAAADLPATGPTRSPAGASAVAPGKTCVTVSLGGEARLPRRHTQAPFSAAASPFSAAASQSAGGEGGGGERGETVGLGAARKSPFALPMSPFRTAAAPHGSAPLPADVVPATPTQQRSRGSDRPDCASATCPRQMAVEPSAVVLPVRGPPRSPFAMAEPLPDAAVLTPLPEAAALVLSTPAASPFAAPTSPFSAASSPFSAPSSPFEAAALELPASHTTCAAAASITQAPAVASSSPAGYQDVLSRARSSASPFAAQAHTSPFASAVACADPPMPSRAHSTLSPFAAQAHASPFAIASSTTRGPYDAVPSGTRAAPSQHHASRASPFASASSQSLQSPSSSADRSHLGPDEAALVAQPSAPAPVLSYRAKSSPSSRVRSPFQMSAASLDCIGLPLAVSSSFKASPSAVAASPSPCSGAASPFAGAKSPFSAVTSPFAGTASPFEAPAQQTAAPTSTPAHLAASHRLSSAFCASASLSFDADEPSNAATSASQPADRPIHDAAAVPTSDVAGRMVQAVQANHVRASPFELANAPVQTSASTRIMSAVATPPSLPNNAAPSTMHRQASPFASFSSPFSAEASPIVSPISATASPLSSPVSPSSDPEDDAAAALEGETGTAPSASAINHDSCQLATALPSRSSALRSGSSSLAIQIVGTWTHSATHSGGGISGATGAGASPSPSAMSPMLSSPSGAAASPCSSSMSICMMEASPSDYSPSPLRSCLLSPFHRQASSPFQAAMSPFADAALGFESMEASPPGSTSSYLTASTHRQAAGPSPFQSAYEMLNTAMEEWPPACQPLHTSLRGASSPVGSTSSPLQSTPSPFGSTTSPFDSAASPFKTAASSADASMSPSRVVAAAAPHAVTLSPFAAQAPFDSAAATAAGRDSSKGAAPSPFAMAAPPPFAAGSGASPFAAPSLAACYASPFAATPSAFAATPSAAACGASPFAATEFLPFGRACSGGVEPQPCDQPFAASSGGAFGRAVSAGGEFRTETWPSKALALERAASTHSSGRPPRSSTHSSGTLSALSAALSRAASHPAECSSATSGTFATTCDLLARRAAIAHATSSAGFGGTVASAAGVGMIELSQPMSPSTRAAEMQHVSDDVPPGPISPTAVPPAGPATGNSLHVSSLPIPQHARLLSDKAGRHKQYHSLWGRIGGGKVPSAPAPLVEQVTIMEDLRAVMAGIPADMLPRNSLKQPSFDDSPPMSSEMSYDPAWATQGTAVAPTYVPMGRTSSAGGTACGGKRRSCELDRGGGTDGTGEGGTVDRAVLASILADPRHLHLLLGLRLTTGTQLHAPLRLPSLMECVVAFNQRHAPHSKSHLTVGARALAKHTHRDAGAAFWEAATGPECLRNTLANRVLAKVFAGAVWINLHSLPSGPSTASHLPGCSSAAGGNPDGSVPLSLPGSSASYLTDAHSPHAGGGIGPADASGCSSTSHAGEVATARLHATDASSTGPTANDATAMDMAASTPTTVSNHLPRDGDTLTPICDGAGSASGFSEVLAMEAGRRPSRRAGVSSASGDRLSSGAVLEIRVAEGYGARWMVDAKSGAVTFRGFLEPQMTDGHARGWRH